MITIWTGKIGGGKSYTAVQSMLAWIASGGVVVTNIALEVEPWNSENKDYLKAHKILYKINNETFNSLGIREVLRRYYSWELQDGQYRFISDDLIRSDSLVDILPTGDFDKPIQCWFDECVDFFDIQDKAKADKNFLSLIVQSRKMSIDFFFIIQKYNNLNVRIREQSHWVVFSVNLQTHKVAGFGKVPFMNGFFRMFIYNTDEFSASRKTIPVEAYNRKKHTYIYSCYRTDALHNSIFSRMQKIENNYKKKGKIEKKTNVFFPAFFISLTILLIFIVLDLFL